MIVIAFRKPHFFGPLMFSVSCKHVTGTGNPLFRILPYTGNPRHYIIAGKYPKNTWPIMERHGDSDTEIAWVKSGLVQRKISIRMSLSNIQNTIWFGSSVTVTEAKWIRVWIPLNKLNYNSENQNIALKWTFKFS